MAWRLHYTGSRRKTPVGEWYPPPAAPTAYGASLPQAPGHTARGLFFCPVATRRGMREPRRGIATVAVHAGAPEGGNAPLTTPIVQSTTYQFESVAQVQAYQRGESGLYMYSRDENPTVRAAEAALTHLEGAEAAVLFASGMGAMPPALLGLSPAGSEVVPASALYGGTYKLL